MILDSSLTSNILVLMNLTVFVEATTASPIRFNFLLLTRPSHKERIVIVLNLSTEFELKPMSISLVSFAFIVHKRGYENIF